MIGATSPGSNSVGDESVRHVGGAETLPDHHKEGEKPPRRPRNHLRRGRVLVLAQTTETRG